MNRRLLWSIAGVAAILGFVAYGAGAFKSNLTPYVSFAQARSSGEPVQVAGKLVQGSDRYDEATQVLHFALEDDHGEKLLIAYKGLKPGTSTRPPRSSRSAATRPDSWSREAAREVPSKYQGVENKEYGSRTS